MIGVIVESENEYAAGELKNILNTSFYRSVSKYSKVLFRNIIIFVVKIVLHETMKNLYIFLPFELKKL